MVIGNLNIPVTLQMNNSICISHEGIIGADEAA